MNGRIGRDEARNRGWDKGLIYIERVQAGTRVSEAYRSFHQGSFRSIHDLSCISLPALVSPLGIRIGQLLLILTSSRCVEGPCGGGGVSDLLRLPPELRSCTVRNLEDGGGRDRQ